MNKSLSQFFHFKVGATSVHTSEVCVRLHYNQGTEVDEIENFRIGRGISFLLTFIGGGTVAIDLTDVKEIRFVGLADCSKSLDAGIPVYQVRVAMENGRVLEGFSADLHSFSGLKSGQNWCCSLKADSADQNLHERLLARIVVRDSRQQLMRPEAPLHA